MDLLLKNDSNIDCQDISGMSPLMYALENSKTETAKFLINKNCDISLIDNNGHKAIDYATAFGLRDIIVLLSKDINNINNYGNSLLHQACYNDQSEVVKEILKSNKNDINKINNSGNTPLIIATYNDNLVIVKELIKNGADINLKLLNGNNALHFAVEGNNFYIAEELIKNKINIDEQNQDGDTALIIAAYNGHKDLVKLLLNNHANPNLVDKEKKQCFILCFWKRFYWDCRTIN